MKKIRSIVLALILSLIAGMVGSSANASLADPALPPSIEENRGQLAGDARFVIRDVGYTLGVAPDRLEFMFPGAAAGQTVRLSFPEGNLFPKLVGETRLPGKVHYLVGSDPDEWIAHIPTFASARFESLYEGIDLVIGGRRGALTLEFELAATADYEDLVLQVDGLEPVDLSLDGAIRIGDALRLPAPEIVQRSSEHPVTTPGAFVLIDGNRVAIDPRLPEITVPTTVRIRLDGELFPAGLPRPGGEPAFAVSGGGDVTVAGRTMAIGTGEAFVTRLSRDGKAVHFTTYLGGSGIDLPAAVAVDSAGRPVVVGSTTSGADFPTVGERVEPAGGQQDAFIVRLSRDGSDLVQSALFGGARSDRARDIVIARDRSVWIGGDTEGEFPGGGDTADVWVARLDAEELAPLFSSTIGGSGRESGASLGLDRDGNLHIAGTTDSEDFPLLAPRPPSNEMDTFLLTLSSQGQPLQTTRLGRPGSQGDPELAVDTEGSVYVSGFQTTASLAGGAFIDKVDPSGHAMVWSPPLAGGAHDRARAIALDREGQLWISGGIESDDSPTVDARRPSRHGDALISRLGPGGSSYPGDGASTTIEAIETSGDAVLALGRGRSSEVPDAQVIGSDPEGRALFLARVESHNPAPRVAGCPGTINFDDSSGTGQWHEPTNWDTDALPTSSDDVCIDNHAVTLSLWQEEAGTLYVTSTASLELQNQGRLTLTADSAIDGTFTLDDGTVNGTAALTLNGTFDWIRGTFSLSGGVLANGTVNISGFFSGALQDCTFRNSSLVNWSGGGIVVNGSSAMVNDGTWEVSSDGLMSRTPYASGSFTNNGTFRKTSATGVTEITAAFHNDGVVDLQNGTLHLVGGGLSSGSFAGAGTVIFDEAYASGDHDLLATARLAVAAVTVEGGTTVNISGEYDVPGTLTMNGGFLHFNDGAVVTSVGDVDSSGSIYFDIGSPFTLNSVNLTGGSLNGAGPVTIDGTFDWAGGGLSVINGVVANGTVNITGTVRHTIWNGTFRNTSTVNLNGTGMVEPLSGSAIVNDGAWDVTNDARVFTPNVGSVRFTNNGTFRKSTTAGTSVISTEFVNSGAVEILAGTLDFTGGFTQTAGSTTLNGGSLASTGLATVGRDTLQIQGGILAGMGTIGAHVDNGGSIAPGLSAGLLDIDGRYTEGGSGGIAIELGGLAAGTQHDRLGVTETADLGGTLNVSLIDGFVPANGDSFTILQASSVTGTFASVNAPPLPGGDPWQVTYGATSVVLSVGGASCADADNDGYALCDGTCTLSPGDACGDCDDGDATTYPGATELCDGLDNDCDVAVPANETDADGDGYRVCQADCDDTDSGAYPGATELTCDGVDQNCNGLSDDAPDFDDDGYDVCVDCDDTDDRVYPGGAEVCDDSLDNDCDGLVDASDSADCGIAGVRTLCASLGDEVPAAEVDQDLFAFNGSAGEQISLSLTAVDTTSVPRRATLLLLDTTTGSGTLLGSDRTPLPNQLGVTLPSDGPYRVAVHEEPDDSLLSGSRFSGAYCLTLGSDLGAAQSLQPTSSVEGIDSTSLIEDPSPPPSRSPKANRTRSRQAQPARRIDNR